MIENKAHKGNDIDLLGRMLDLEQCTERCQDTSNCVGFTYTEGVLLSCWIHHTIDVEKIMDIEGTQLFVKECPNIPDQVKFLGAF